MAVWKGNGVTDKRQHVGKTSNRRLRKGIKQASRGKEWQRIDK